MTTSDEYLHYLHIIEKSNRKLNKMMKLTCCHSKLKESTNILLLRQVRLRQQIDETLAYTNGLIAARNCHIGNIDGLNNKSEYFEKQENKYENQHSSGCYKAFTTAYKKEETRLKRLNVGTNSRMFVNPNKRKCSKRKIVIRKRSKKEDVAKESLNTNIPEFVFTAGESKQKINFEFTFTAPEISTTNESAAAETNEPEECIELA
jgi:hypothetical protein